MLEAGLEEEPQLLTTEAWSPGLQETLDGILSKLFKKPHPRDLKGLVEVTRYTEVTVWGREGGGR